MHARNIADMNAPQLGQTDLHVLASWNRWDALSPASSWRKTDEGDVLAMAEALLARGEWATTDALNAAACDGCTPLMEACQAAFSPRLVRLLVRKGADPLLIPVPKQVRVCR